MQNWKVTKKEEIQELAESLPPNDKISKLINGDLGGNYATAVVVIDNVKGKGEVHEKMRDVWYIISGNGKFNLGGEMENPQPSSKKPGEWSCKSLNGAETISVGPGDVIDIPPGVPHQIDAIGNRLEIFLVKVPV